MKYVCVIIVSVIIAACGRNSRVIKIKGSDTEVNLAVNLAEEFYKHNNLFSVAISGGGSGLGIASLLNGQADIANSSRPLTEEEIALFAQKGIQIRTIVFAEDATAFVVHKNNPLDSIDIPTLGKVLSGEYDSWKSLTENNQPITIYGRQSNSGTHSFVRKKLGIRFSRKAKEMNGNAQILEAIKHDVTGIGYVGAGYILNGFSTNSDIKILKIINGPDAQAISPLDASAIQNHQYYFQRPLFQFVPEKSWEKVQPFLAYEMSTEGKAMIAKEGYYNVNAEIENEN